MSIFSVGDHITFVDSRPMGRYPDGAGTIVGLPTKDIPTVIVWIDAANNAVGFKEETLVSLLLTHDKKREGRSGRNTHSSS